jgi:hypothetical protein
MCSEKFFWCRRLGNAYGLGADAVSVCGLGCVYACFAARFNIVCGALQCC